MKSYPEITTLIMEDAGRLYRYTLQNGVKEFTFRPRMNNEIRFSYDKENFMTVHTAKTVTDLNLSESVGGITIYFQSAVKGEVIEIETWK